MIPPVDGEEVDGGQEGWRELVAVPLVLLVEDVLLEDGEARVDDLEVEVNQLPAMGGDDALDLVHVVHLVVVPGRCSVRQHQECVMVADFSEGPSGQETFILGIEGREIDQRGLKVRRRADVLAIAVLLKTERALEQGWSSKVGHFFDQRVTGGRARPTGRVLPQPSVI